MPKRIIFHKLSHRGCENNKNFYLLSIIHERLTPQSSLLDCNMNLFIHNDNSLSIAYRHNDSILKIGE
jgi:hypothetical protein